MQKLTSSRSLAALALAITATILTSGCQPSSTEAIANKLNSSEPIEILSFNDRMAPNSRQFVNYGQIPETARRAIIDYIKTGEWKNVTYIHPQAFIRLNHNKEEQGTETSWSLHNNTATVEKSPIVSTVNKPSYWAICTNTAGQLLGIMPAHNADKLPTIGDYKLIVNTTPRANGLSYAILKSLVPTDAYRKSIRKSEGLETPIPVVPTITKPIIKPTSAPAIKAGTAKQAPAPAPAPVATDAPATDSATPAATDTKDDDIFGGGDTKETPEASSDTPAETPADSEESPF
ncbi:MAG: hypothetical protein RSB24_01515 [Akkermansia sp.]